VRRDAMLRAIMRAPVRLAFANLRPVKLVASHLHHHYLET
jgi:hypothetical protein